VTYYEANVYGGHGKLVEAVLLGQVDDDNNSAGIPSFHPLSCNLTPPVPTLLAAKDSIPSRVVDDDNDDNGDAISTLSTSASSIAWVRQTHTQQRPSRAAASTTAQISRYVRQEASPPLCCRGCFHRDDYM